MASPGPRKRFDPARALARVACGVLSIVGLLPLLLAIVVRTPWVRAKAVDLVGSLLQDELGLEAHFSLSIELLPPAVVLTGLTLPANDGGSPAVQVERARVAPRLFSLIAGRLDAGDIEIERPRVRLVIEDGAPANLTLRLPPSKPKDPSAPPPRLPFRSLAISQASVDLDLRGAATHLRLDEIDLDLATGEGMVVDGRLQAGRGTVQRKREGAVDNDTLCGLELRAHLGEGALLIRKLGLEARLDEDPKDGEAPSCEGTGPREQKLSVALSSLRVAEGPELLPLVRGRLAFELPLRVIRRFVPTAPLIEGSAGLDVDLSFEGKKELPTLSGTLRGREVKLFGKRMIAHSLDAKIEATPTEVRLPEVLASYGDGEVTLRGVRAQPFAEGIPIEVPEVDIRGLQFPGLVRDLGVTAHTVVAWTFDHATIRNFQGHVGAIGASKGPHFMGDVVAQTRDFELTDLAFDDPHRRRVIGTKQASVRGKFGIEPYGAVFRQMAADFGHSHLDIPAVTIGFEEILEVRIGEGTHLELGEITPLLTLPIGGRLELKGAVGGGQSHPKIDGELRATNLRIADLPLADEATAKISFVPFTIDLTKFHGKKGRSSYDAPLIRLDFNRPSGVRVDGNLSAKSLDYRDLLAIFQFENDPRLTDVHGTGDARASLRFEVDGPNDPCHSGAMSIRAQVEMGPSSLYGEFYDGGDAEIDLDWFDRAALERGMEATIRSATLRKGKGLITGAGSVRQGGLLRGHFSAQGVPIGRIDAMAAMGVVSSPWALTEAKQVVAVAAPKKPAAAVDGTVSASGEIGGSIDAIEARGLISVSPVRIGQRTLPSSTLALRLEPAAKKEQTGTKVLTKCGNIVPGGFSAKDYEKDELKGVYHVSGKMFGEQLKLDDVQTTWQRSKRVTGVVEARRFDLGALFQLSPTFALAEQPPVGGLSGRLKIDRYDLDHPEKAAMTARLDFLEIGQGASRAHLQGKEPVEIHIADDRLQLSKLGFGLSVGQDVGADIEIGGQVTHLTTSRDLDLEVRLSPLEIGPFLASVPKVEAAEGKLEGKLSITGPADAPISRGELRLRDGSIQVRGMPVALDNLELLARVDERELRIVQATAKAGGGTVSLTARAPLNGFEVGEVTARLDASDVHLVLAEGVEMSAGASLVATWSPPGADGVKHRTMVNGSVNLQSFLYSRPITIAADLDSLARRGKRTEVTVYDPEEDTVDFSINIRAAQPLVFRNNLIEAEVNLDSEALTLSGTNQRFGLRGQLRVGKGGRIWLRSNEFDIRQGTIRFDDPTRIAPRVDLLASTDFRRYTTSSAAGGAAPGAAAAPSGGGAGATGHAGGAWRITMHAHGDADNLKLDLASEPDLAQEDIVLLLTIGMTRAELDQLQAANLGSTAALEALSALSGADRAVKTVIPIIDDFRFGTAYSTRTGRTEPTVTVGKRISDRLRANVITGLSENRDVRSNIEWRLTPSTSVLGNYDNLNDVTSQGLGNLGADFRVRLEF